MFDKRIIDDLHSVGLSPNDMHIRDLGSAERGATNTSHGVQGYVIPYFDMMGKPLPFYRVRVFDLEVWFKQPKDSSNHIYFPRDFSSNVTKLKRPFIMVVETEREAVLLAKSGIPAVALGSISGWQNRTIVVSADSQLRTDNNLLTITLPNTHGISESYTSAYSTGLTTLIDQAAFKNWPIVICLASDRDFGGPTNDVQKACTTFAYELRFSGIPFGNIKQLVLPTIRNPAPEFKETRVDNYISTAGIDEFKKLLQETLLSPRRFPKHPNAREYVNKRLQKPTLSRKESQSVAMTILSDLDARGMRLKSQAGDTYYFDLSQKKLVKAWWGRPGQEQFDSPLIQYLYQVYGLSAVDQKVNVWLGTLFTSETPIDQVTPNKIYARPNTDEDAVYYQISDSEYVKVSAEGLQVCNNGDYGILFEADQVAPVNTRLLKEEFERLNEEDNPSCWWANTLSQVRLRDKDKQKMLAALLYYMSPWLYRWRGMQLPIELILGESGSGKSTLCELRLEILTGRPILRNAPNDLKDWHASITSSGGLHITDNVQLVDKQMRQRLSDEICRIITEPEPFVEQRKLYTNAEQVRLPVRAVFGITAIQQPFLNADLLQRAVLVELDKSASQATDGIIKYDSYWKQKQLNKYGKGRETWLAHHLVVLHRFFKIVKADWDSNYSAKHRLINFEQSLLLMGKVFKIKVDWIPDFIVSAQDRATTEADWTLEGLQEFAWMWFNAKGASARFTAAIVAEWAIEHEDYKNCEILVNSRKLGRYIKSHKASLYNIIGILEHGTENNKQGYKIAKKPQQPSLKG